MTNEEFANRILAMKQTLYRVSYSQLSQGCDREDAVQECLCKAWKNKDKLREERYMQTWVVRILINECRSIQKRRKNELPLEKAAHRCAPNDSNYELHDAILNLKDDLRLPIVLHYMEGFTIAEIADILHLPKSTVGSRLNRGRLELKRYLSEEVLVTC